MIRHVIFDLDGVLSNTTSLQRNAFVSVVTKLVHQEPELDNVLRSLDHSITTIEKLSIINRTLGTDLDASVVSPLKDALVSSKIPEIPSDTELCELLSFLKKKSVKLSVVSNARQWYVDKVLIQLGIHHLMDYVLSSDLADGKTKPNTYLFELAIDLSNISPLDTLVVEDSQCNINAVADLVASTWLVSNPSETKQRVRKHLID